MPEASGQYQSRAPSAEIAMPSAPIVIGCRSPSGSSCSTNGRPSTIGTNAGGCSAVVEGWSRSARHDSPDARSTTMIAFSPWSEESVM